MAEQTRYASKDAFMGKQISGSFSGWNGKDNHLPVGVSISGTYKWRSVVYFSIDFSPMLSITSATLYLYDHATGSNLHSNQTSAPSQLDIRRCTKDWGEGSTDPGEGNLSSSMSWDWNNRYDANTTSNQTTKSITQGSNGHEQSFDVTDIVRDWFNGSNNYGFMIVHNNETDANRGVQFYSREAGGALRPKLVIEYSVNSAPLAPVLTSPIDAAIQNTMSPSLSFTRTDNDTGDYITAYQCQVRRPTLRYTFSTTTTSGPASGTIRFNTTNPQTATVMYISETDADGNSAVSTLDSWAVGGILSVDEPQSDLFTYAEITAKTDSGSYRTINITPEYFTVTNFTNGASIYVDAAAVGAGYLAGVEMADTGVVSVSGSPTSVSTVYGAVGTSTALSGNTYYKWRARTRDKALEWGPYSDWEFFKVNTPPNNPTLVVLGSPSTDIADNTPDFVVTHNDIDPADTLMYAYQVVVEKETSVGSGSWTSTGGWDTGQVDTSGSPATTKTVTSATLDWGGSYRVKARTQDSNGAWSSYCSWVTFAIHATGAPTSLSPSGSESVSATPTFTGSRASSVDTITSYQIVLYDSTLAQIWDSGTISTGIVSGASFSKTYPGSPTLTAGATYYWKARVTGSIGGTSEYSSTQTFVVVDATTPSITSPVTTGLTLTPTVTASRASSFNRIQFEIYPSTSTSASLGTAHYQSGTVSASIGAGGLGTQYSATYSGTALAWSTTYKIRARVSSDGGSNWSSWSGLQAFSTNDAAAPTLTSISGVAQSGTPVIGHTTPVFLITRNNGETIDYARVRVLDAAGTTEIWDSTLTNVTNATTASITYAGPALVPGTTYSWTASYQSTSGPVGPEATPARFRINAAPDIPTGLYPPSGHVYSTNDQIRLEAIFSDADTSSFGDTPSKWALVIQEADGSPVYESNLTSNLVVGLNTTVWAGTALTTAVDYEWRTRFFDSSGYAGPYSAWNSFSVETPPAGTWSSPSSGWPTVNTVNTKIPDVSWNFSGGTQLSYSIDIDEADSSGNKVRDVAVIEAVSASTTKTIPDGYLVKDKYYNLTLTVRNTDGLYDPAPDMALIYVDLDAPDPITGVSPTIYEDLSLIKIEWDTGWSLLSGHTFVSYNIYRRLVGDADWTEIGTVSRKQTGEYDDWYAGHGLAYEYRVTVTTRKSGQGLVESGDDGDGGSICQSTLDSDVWMIVGNDRSDENIQEIQVEDEDHNRPIQQEAFETLGSNRKVIVRGFVLGHEGQISILWDSRQVVSETDPDVYYDYTVIGRRLIDYITNNKGPHILKSPFGDVWDVEFSGPSLKWRQGGHLEATISWTETGSTSQVSV